MPRSRGARSSRLTASHWPEARALQDVRDAAATLAIAATRRLIVESLDEKRADALVDDALAEVADKLH